MLAEDKIKNLIKENTEELESARKEHSRANKRLADARNALYQVENVMASADTTLMWLDAASEIVKGIDTHILLLRSNLMRSFYRAKDDDITIKELRELQAKQVELTSDLRKACDHAFVFVTPYHESYDPDDGADYPERYCTVCGARETSSTRDGKYSVLHSPRAVFNVRKVPISLPEDLHSALWNMLPSYIRTLISDYTQQS